MHLVCRSFVNVDRESLQFCLDSSLRYCDKQEQKIVLAASGWTATLSSTNVIISAHIYKVIISKERKTLSPSSVHFVLDLLLLLF